MHIVVDQRDQLFQLQRRLLQIRFSGKQRCLYRVDSLTLRLAGSSGSLFYVVAGYTDNVGTEKVNYDLARLRADRVASY